MTINAWLPRRTESAFATSNRIKAMHLSCTPTPMLCSPWPPAMAAMGLPPTELPGNSPSEVPGDAPAETPPAETPEFPPPEGEPATPTELPPDQPPPEFRAAGHARRSDDPALI